MRQKVNCHKNKEKGLKTNYEYTGIDECNP